MPFRQFFRALNTILPFLLLVIFTGCSRTYETVYVPINFTSLAQLQEQEYTTIFESNIVNDHITVFYNNEETRVLTIDFFANLTRSQEIAAIILESAIQYNIAPALAFSLAYEESRFNPRAVNQNSDSIDRGLFQLNSKAFEQLTIDQFYNPKINTEYAMKHLRYCMDTSTNEFAALAMYNAGPARVKKGGTPEKTLNYIYRINLHMLNIQSLFEAQVVAKHQQTLAMLSKKFNLR